MIHSVLNHLPGVWFMPILPLIFRFAFCLTISFVKHKCKVNCKISNEEPFLCRFFSKTFFLRITNENRKHKVPQSRQELSYPKKQHQRTAVKLKNMQLLLQSTHRSNCVVKLWLMNYKTCTWATVERMSRKKKADPEKHRLLFQLLVQIAWLMLFTIIRCSVQKKEPRTSQS